MQFEIAHTAEANMDTEIREIDEACILETVFADIEIVVETAHSSVATKRATPPYGTGCC